MATMEKRMGAMAAGHRLSSYAALPYFVRIG